MSVTMKQRVVALLTYLAEASEKVEQQRGKNPGWQQWAGLKVGLALSREFPKEAAALGDEIVDDHTSKLIHKMMGWTFDDEETPTETARPN